MMVNLQARRWRIFLNYYVWVTRYNLGISLLFLLPSLADPVAGTKLALFTFCFIGYPFVLYMANRFRPGMYYFYHNFGFGKWQLWLYGALANCLLVVLFQLVRYGLLPLLWQF